MEEKLLQKQQQQKKILYLVFVYFYLPEFFSYQVKF